ncbi:bifunctional protein-serine/threonine kinase/phosphatase [Shewanella sp. WXL01]|uniref:bifunctional protein-serine/threonine kinase/phosphatase n=1 Tax=Shewanella sp. WXL01 TaxID=2709721 RepID=UPI0014383FB5|nr:bifunctional protein-serine/threonine kinase/phosphatase [Shewanella sp. WXL01]NKF50625.1 bifunctional protein-serine/threonine kinase/phosphatase [Shewanella sp. WXL01]
MTVNKLSKQVTDNQALGSGLSACDSFPPQCALSNQSSRTEHNDIKLPSPNTGCEQTIDHLSHGQSLTVTVGQSSNAGVKTENQDAIGIRIPEGLALTTKGIVSVISDGVSTAEAAAQASQISVTNFIADYYSTPDTWGVQTSSTKVLTALNRWLYGLGQDYRDARRGFVCTFSALVLKSCSAHILHAGDSRVYLFRDGQISRLTQDHVTEVSGSKTYLTRALGMDVKLSVDYRKLSIRQSDVFLLTTDGIHDVLTDNELASRLSWFVQTNQFQDNDCEHFCQQLIAKALDCASNDNLSAQLLFISDLPDQQIEDVYQQLSDKPFPPPMNVGNKLDGYQVTHILHQSQRSQVYRVVDSDGNAYCMKTPSVNYLDDAAYIERFVLESWVGNRIQNPNVVKVCHSSQHKSAVYYLTEFLDGVSLAQWIEHNPKSSVETVFTFVKQIEAGVRAFHRKETLHQDLKPDNIFVTRQEQVKIIDFGSCYIKGIAEIATPLVRDKILGTADYSAPELMLGYQADSRADQFSLAVITYEMLAGQLPFAGKLAQCKSRHDYLKLSYIPVYQSNPMVPEWIDDVLRKALSIEPSFRFADTHEFVHELTRVNYPSRKSEFVPLIQRDPTRFWQAVSAILLMCLLLSIFFF